MVSEVPYSRAFLASTRAHAPVETPGRDEEAWLALSADVFAEHPEQGRLTRLDLDRRMSEPWFDPAGFLLAERGAELVGYHWTKVHGGSADHHDHEPLGEVYVVGVARSERGTGLGRQVLVDEEDVRVVLRDGACGVLGGGRLDGHDEAALLEEETQQVPLERAAIAHDGGTARGASLHAYRFRAQQPVALPCIAHRRGRNSYPM